MNLFNRLVIIIIFILVAIAGAFALITPAGAISAVQAAANHGASLLNFAPPGILRTIVRLLFAFLWLALMGILLWLELRRPNKRVVEVRGTDDGKVQLSTNDVQQKLTQSILNMAGVQKASVNVVAPSGKEIRASVEAVTDPDVDLSAKGTEIAALVRNVVEDQLGVKLSGRPQVNVKAGKPRKGGKAAPATDIALPAPSEPIDTSVVIENGTPSEQK